MPTPEQEARRIFGERAAFYTTSACHKDPDVLARVVELAAPQPDMLALDVATGAGHTAFALAPHVRAVVATDITPAMLAEAGRLGHERDIDNVRFCLADVHSLPFGDESFRVVVSRRAPHHFSDIMRALREMRRTLAPGGRLVIDDRSVPDASEDAVSDSVDACMNELDRLHDESHVRQYRPSAWRALLEAAGFVVEAVEPYTRHRPLSSLTEGVAPENVAQIHAILEGLDTKQREAFNLAEKDGELYLNHWYVTIAARRDS